MSSAAYRITQRVMASTRPKTICTCEHPEPMRNATMCACVLVCQRCRLLVDTEETPTVERTADLLARARRLLTDLRTVSHRRRIGGHSLGDMATIVQQLIDRLEPR